jgi:hypothetical protein
MHLNASHGHTRQRLDAALQPGRQTVAEGRCDALALCGFARMDGTLRCVTGAGFALRGGVPLSRWFRTVDMVFHQRSPVAPTSGGVNDMSPEAAFSR